ncbi:MAG: hypothetical protein ACK4E3_10700 [Brevundimonas sp.]|uniref:hypothetical protein n=1 Tax=Brevundimonas sp. TaxID=1871086 RepID=UPI00391B27C1
MASLLGGHEPAEVEKMAKAALSLIRAEREIMQNTQSNDTMSGVVDYADERRLREQLLERIRQLAQRLEQKGLAEGHRAGGPPPADGGVGGKRP